MGTATTDNMMAASVLCASYNIPYFARNACVLTTMNDDD
jgi:hypothetical protein